MIAISYLIDALVAPGLAPPGSAALLFAGIGQVSGRVEGESPPKFRAANSLGLFVAGSMRSVIRVRPPLRLPVPGQVSDGLGRRRGAEIDAADALDAAAGVPFLGAGAPPPSVPGVRRFHVVNRVRESERSRVHYVSVCIVAQINGTRALAVGGEALVTRRRDVAQLRDRYLRPLLRFRFRHLVVGVPGVRKICQNINMSFHSERNEGGKEMRKVYLRRSESSSRFPFAGFELFFE